MRNVTPHRVLFTPTGFAMRDIPGSPSTNGGAIDSRAVHPGIVSDALACASDRDKPIALRATGTEPPDIQTNIARALLDHIDALAHGEPSELAIADTRGRVVLLTPTSILQP